MAKSRKLRRQKVVNSPAPTLIRSCDDKPLRLVEQDVNRKGCTDGAALDAYIVTILDLRSELVDFVSVDDDSPGRDECIARAT